MNPARWVAEHGRAVVLATLLAAGAGALALRALPRDIYPPLVFPRLLAIAHAGSTPSRTMLIGVTRPLEQALMEVPGVRRVRSRTFRGASQISAQFEPTTDMPLALQRAQGRVDEARGDLPDETELTLDQLTPSEFPIYSINLTGGLPVADLYDYAFQVVRPAMSRVAGVGRVEVTASDQREIEVVAEPSSLLAAGLTAVDLADALSGTNRLEPVARFDESGQQRLGLVSGLWAGVDDIARTPLPAAEGEAPESRGLRRIGDVARVFPGSPDRTSLITGGGKEAALINISQQPGSNIEQVRAGIEQTVGELTQSLPSGLKLTKVYDLAEFVSEAVGSVRDAILVGGILAVIVLFVFLRDIRLTLIAATTLPLTACATFLVMLPLGGTINLMSMGGLAVAIGLVIDDAVVVIENIHRRLADQDAGAAIESALEELTGPVVSSTLTTVVVLVPLGLLTGLVGQFFRALSLSLSIAVLISLVLSLTWVPLVVRVFSRRGGDRPREKESERPGRLETTYARGLRAALGRPGRAGLILAALGVAAGALAFLVPSGFLPHMDEGGFVIDYVTAPGSSLSETERQIKKVESLLTGVPEIASFNRRTGSELGMFATQQNTGDILVRLRRRSERDRSADEIIAGLRPEIAEAIPGVEIEFVQLLQDMLGDLEGASDPIEVKIFGDDPEALSGIAAEVAEKIEGIEGVVDIVAPQAGNPELTWNVDAGEAARMGLTVEEVAAQVQAGWLGRVATQLQLADRTIPVRVRFPDSVRTDPARLAEAPIRGAGDARAMVVPLSALAHGTLVNGQSELTRENLRSMALVTAHLEDRDLGGAVKEIRDLLEPMPLPIGVSLEVGGQYESQQRAFRQLLQVFALAAALVLVILVIQLRSLRESLLLLAAAPLSFAGAFGLLLVTGTELNVSSAMGLVLLVGLVVKNGIVMLDCARRLRAQGVAPREAIEQAGRLRLRPILMTTLCTLFGLLPLALGLGSGAELQKPLALAVIGGLGISTLVTLLAVPALAAFTPSRREAPPAAEERDPA